MAAILTRVGNVDDENLIIAALLHDTIEDTQTSADEIKKIFGDVVLGFVVEMTDDKSLEKAERKRLQVVNTPKKSIGAKQIKLSDKICNIRGMSPDSPATWTHERKVEYLDWAEEVASGCFGANHAIDELFKTELKRVRQCVG